MATSKRTSRPKAAAAPAPAAALTPEGLERFLGLTNKGVPREQIAALLEASEAEAQSYLGVEVPAEKRSHAFQQGVLHLAAKFYAVGNSEVEDPSELPPVCRYFFELVRSELSGTAQ